MKKTNSFKRSSRDSFKMMCAGRDDGGTVDIGYKTYYNGMPSSQEAAPCLARACPSDSLTQDDIVDAMVKDGCHMKRDEINRVLDYIGVYVMEHMPDDGCSYDLGFVRLFPALTGSFTSLDAPFDPAVNTVYVAAAASDAIRNVLAGGVPEQTAGTGDGIRMRNVTWGDQSDRNTIRSGEEFYVYGTGLDLVEEGATAGLNLPDGTTADVELDSRTAAEDASQRLTGRLTARVQACKGAVLWINARWGDAESSMKRVASDRLTVLDGDPPPPAPTITGVTGEGADNVNLGGCDVSATGENLETATRMEFAETEDGAAFYAMDAEYADGTLSGFADFIGTAPDNGFVRVTTAGGTATRAVTFSNH